jgi:hypothetical protein
MLRLTAERPGSWTDGGASTDHQTSRQDGVLCDTTKRAHGRNKRRCGLLPTALITAAAVLTACAAIVLAGMAYEAHPGATVLVTCSLAMAAGLRELHRWGGER